MTISPKRLALKILQVVSIIAGVIFFFVPLATATQVILCIGAFFVFVICTLISGGFDDKNTGYWPDSSRKF